MNLNKMVSLGQFLIPTVLAAGVIAVVTTTSVVLFTKKSLLSYPYNQFVTNFSKSTEANDLQALNYYQKHTFSLSYKLSLSTHYGTAWYWGSEKPGSDVSYFATNLHVVSSILQYNNDPSIEYAKRFSLDPLVVLQYATYDKPTKTNDFANTKLKKLHLVENHDNRIVNSDGKSLYSDLAIFETTTKFSYPLETLDFIDDDIELNNVIENMSTSTFYIAGFPFNKNLKTPLWTTGKYKWTDNEYFNKQEIGWSTPWALFGESNYRKPRDSDADFLHVPGASGPTPLLSYARQLILPGLNFEGGSSGSLVTVWNSQTNKLQPIGIYWGVYTAKDKYNETFYYGGLDLFYTSQFNFFKDGPQYYYDNSPTIKK